MKFLSASLIFVACLTVGINLFALFVEEPGAYVLICNWITGAALLLMVLLSVFGERKMQQLQQTYIDRFFSRN